MNPINFGSGVSLFHWSKTSLSSRMSLNSKAFFVIKKAKPRFSKILVA